MPATAVQEIQPLQEAQDTFVRWLQDRMEEYEMTKEDLQLGLRLDSTRKAARIMSGNDVDVITLEELKDLARLFKVDPFELWQKYKLGDKKITSGELRELAQEGGYEIGRFHHIA